MINKTRCKCMWKVVGKNKQNNTKLTETTITATLHNDEQLDHWRIRNCAHSLNLLRIEVIIVVGV